MSRPLPHSTEAEEQLLACCFIDGASVVARCIETSITPDSFYEPRHGVLFAKLLDLHRRKLPLEVPVVAEELKASGELDAIGGYAFLVQVSSTVATTAQAAYFTQQVHAAATKRRLIRAFAEMSEDCQNLAGSVDDLLAHVKRRVDSLTSATVGAGNAYEMLWDDLMSFDPREDSDCLMGRRFIGRTGGAVIVAPSGVGKSVLSIGLACCAGLGRPFFGVQMAGSMRVLYVQAEDDAGDVAEALQGFLRENPLSPDERARLRSNLRIVRWNDAAGDKFLTRLRHEFARHPWDLVIINPLFSFCGCNVSEQADMSRFLRNGLNPILNDTRSAAVVVHHTNKPPTDGKDRPDANADLRYVGSGSAELTNWARAYITLQPVKGAGEGVARMVFAKRGTRAGIVDENGQPTTSVLIEHSKKGLCWVPASRTAEQRIGGKFVERFDLERALDVYDPNESWDVNEQAIALDQNVSRKTVSRRKTAIESALDTAA